MMRPRIWNLIASIRKMAEANEGVALIMLQISCMVKWTIAVVLKINNQIGKHHINIVKVHLKAQKPVHESKKVLL